MKQFAFTFILSIFSIFGFSQWQSNFGIGIENPQYELDVDGNINISTGHNFLIDGVPISSGNTLWSLNGDNIYFNSGFIGIGTDNPQNPLHIVSQTNSNYLRIDHLSAGGNGSSSVELRDISESNSRGLISRLSDTHQYGGAVYIENIVKGTKVGVLTLNELGNFGIGGYGIQPYAKLQVEDGDIYITDINKGIIMRSPDGQCWRGTIDNTGTLSFSTIDCPSASSTNITPIVQDLIVDLYPNPTKNILNVILSGKNINGIDIEIFDLTGKMIFMKNYKSNSLEINTSDFSTGTYLIKLKDQDGNLLKTEKFVKE